MMMNAAVDALRCIISHQNAKSRSAFFVGKKKNVTLPAHFTITTPTPKKEKKKLGVEKNFSSYTTSAFTPYQKLCRKKLNMLCWFSHINTKETVLKKKIKKSLFQFN